MEFDGAEALLYVLYAGMVIGICYRGLLKIRSKFLDPSVTR